MRVHLTSEPGSRSCVMPPEGPVLSRRCRSLHMSRRLQIRANFVNECRCQCGSAIYPRPAGVCLEPLLSAGSGPLRAGGGGGLRRQRFLADAIFAERFSLAAFPSDNITFLAASHASRLSPFFQRSFKRLRPSPFQHSRLSAAVTATPFGGSRPSQ